MGRSFFWCGEAGDERQRQLFVFTKLSNDTTPGMHTAHSQHLKSIAHSATSNFHPSCAHHELVCAVRAGSSTMSDEEEEVVDPKIEETAKCEKTMACSKLLVAYENCSERIEKKGSGNCAGQYSAPPLQMPNARAAVVHFPRLSASPVRHSQWTTSRALISAYVTPAVQSPCAPCMLIGADCVFYDRAAQAKDAIMGKLK